MSSEDAIRKGQAAKALLESADFSIALDSVRLQAYKGFANSAPEAKEDRESNYHLLRAVTQLTENLQALVANARVEEYKAARDQAAADAKPTTNSED